MMSENPNLSEEARNLLEFLELLQRLEVEEQVQRVGKPG